MTVQSGWSHPETARTCPLIGRATIRRTSHRTSRFHGFARFWTQSLSATAARSARHRARRASAGALGTAERSRAAPRGPHTPRRPSGLREPDAELTDRRRGADPGGRQTESGRETAHSPVATRRADPWPDGDDHRWLSTSLPIRADGPRAGARTDPTRGDGSRRRSHVDGAYVTEIEPPLVCRSITRSLVGSLRTMTSVDPPLDDASTR